MAQIRTIQDFEGYLSGSFTYQIQFERWYTENRRKRMAESTREELSEAHKKFEPLWEGIVKCLWADYCDGNRRRQEERTRSDKNLLNGSLKGTKKKHITELRLVSEDENARSHNRAYKQSLILERDGTLFFSSFSGGEMIRCERKKIFPVFARDLLRIANREIVPLVRPDNLLSDALEVTYDDGTFVYGRIDGGERAFVLFGDTLKMFLPVKGLFDFGREEEPA